MDKIDLNAIIRKDINMVRIRKDQYRWDAIRDCMKEAIHQALVLVSEKATFENYTYSNENDKILTRKNIGFEYNIRRPVISEGWRTDKQSILDVEKLII